jgi:hypothetical protein
LLRDHITRKDGVATHPAEKRVSYTFDALGMTINRTAFNLQNGFAPNSLSLYNGNSSGNGNISDRNLEVRRILRRGEDKNFPA